MDNQSISTLLNQTEITGVFITIQKDFLRLMTAYSPHSFI